MSSDKIIEWLKQDHYRIKILSTVTKLNLPECYVAAGFVRNLVWDKLHTLQEATLLNDVDVIYFDPSESNTEQYKCYESVLNKSIPIVNWQVRNQAHMHKRNGDKPYLSIKDAMSFWPEKETAVAIRFIGTGQYECIIPITLIN